jgi:hypothetical protein
MGGSSGGSSGGGGGSSSSSTVSDAEFDRAMAEDEANKAGTNYGSNSYDSSSSSSTPTPAPAPVYTAADGSTYSSQADADAHDAQVAQAAFDSLFNQAIAAEQALEDAYALDAFNITGDVTGGIQYSFTDPFTGATQTVDSTDQFEGLLTGAIAAEDQRVFESEFQAAQDQAAALNEAYAVNALNVTANADNTLSYTVVDPNTGAEVRINALSEADPLLDFISQSGSTYKTLEQEFQEAQDEFAALEAKYATDMQAAEQAKIDAIAAQDASALAAAQEAEAAFEAEFQAAQDQFATLESDYQSKLASSQDAYTSLESEFEAAQDQFADLEADYQSKLEAANAESDAFEAEFTAAQQQFADLEAKYAADMQAAEQAKADAIAAQDAAALAAAQEAEAAFDKEFQAAQDEFAALEEDYQSKLSASQDAYTALDTEFATAQQQFADLEADYQSKLGSSEEAYASLESEFEAAQDQFADLEADYQAKLEAANTENDTLEAEFAEAEAQFADLEADYQAKLEASQQAKADAIAAKDAEAAKAAEEAEAAFEAEFQAAQDEFANLEADYQAKLDSANAENDTLEAEFAEAEAQFADLEADYQAKLDSAVSEQDALEQEFEAAQEQFANLEADYQQQLATSDAELEAALRAEQRARTADDFQRLTTNLQDMSQSYQEPSRAQDTLQSSIVSSIFPNLLGPVINSPTYTNALGQQYTQADIDALGTQTATGTLIGNVANRVVNPDGTTGYLIGTGNNQMDNGMYNLSDTNYAAEGLAAQQRQAEAGSVGMFDVPSPKPDVLRNDPYNSIVPVEERIADWYDKTFEALDSKNPESYVEYDNYVQPSATQAMDVAIESGQGITDLTLENYTIGDMDSFLGAYSEKNLGVDFAENSQGIYGTGPEGFNNFLGAAEKAKENGSSWFTGEPDLAIAPNGTVVAEDPVSFGNIIRQIMGGLANQVMGGIAGNLVGSLVYSLAGGFKAPLYSALFTKSAVQGLSPLETKTFVDENGKEYVETNFFGNKTFQSIDEIVAAQAERDKRYDAGDSASDSGYTGGLDAPIKNLDAAVKANPSWRDAYNSVSGIDITGAIVGAAGNLNLTPLAGSTLEAATYLVQGENPITAVVKAFGDDLTANLPDGYSQITESAALMMAGVSPVEALAEVYGTELLGDSPAAAGAIKGAVALDQGKSPEEALGIAAYHYFKNGGTLPDFEAPSFLQGAEIDLPSIDLSFIEDGARAAWEFAKELMPDIDLDIAWDGDVPSLPNFPDFDMSGLVDALKGTARDVRDWVASIQGPSIPEVDLPSVDIDLPDIDLDIFGNMLAGRSTGATDLDAVLTSALPTSNFVDSGTPLSRQVLKRGYKQV